MHPSQLEIKNFTYDLPNEKIANYPLENRDESKLLVYKNNEITEASFKNLVDYLPENSVLIFYNTKVIRHAYIFSLLQTKQLRCFVWNRIIPMEMSVRPCYPQKICVINAWWAI